MAKKKPCPCGEPSIPGLTPSVSLCQTHYNALMFQQTTAAHGEAVTMLHRQKS